ncbi:MAG: hypothetical protein KGJ56_03570 [Gammaproteobacteria bacterium]|nr:hypothetical protein [Gammaproteobacteria bacterium]
MRVSSRIDSISGLATAGAVVGLFLLLHTPAHAAGIPLPPQSVTPIPGAGHGIGFDDFGFAPELDKVLIPAGAGRGEGTTSAVHGTGYLFASDHYPAEVVVINPRSKAVIERIKLQGGLDYVRFVSSRNKLWITRRPRTGVRLRSPCGPHPGVQRPVSAGRGCGTLPAVTGYPMVFGVPAAPAGVWMLS